MTLTIRPLTSDDRLDWNKLYEGYATFYEAAKSEEMRNIVFGWLMDPDHDCAGLVAEDAQGTLIGFAHYRPYPSPLGACMNGFLDDLFVTPTARGTGASDALLETIVEIGKQKGWQKIRWITADDNYRGRGLYDKHATRTMWVTYDMPTNG